MEIIVKDFEKYSKEFFYETRLFNPENTLAHYRLPNSEKIHSMICGEKYVFESEELFTTAESIDYLKYEKELWNLNNQTQ